MGGTCGQPTRRANLRAGLVVLVALVAGCTNIGPTISERTPEELGPFPQNYEQITRRWIDDHVRAVSSIDRVSISPPKPGFADAIWMRRRFGWAVFVSFSARDRAGFSKGRISYALLIRNDEVVAHQKRI